MALFLPLFRLTSLRVQAGAAQFFSIRGIACVLWAATFKFVANNEALQQA